MSIYYGDKKALKMLVEISQDVDILYKYMKDRLRNDKDYKKGDPLVFTYEDAFSFENRLVGVNTLCCELLKRMFCCGICSDVEVLLKTIKFDELQLD